MYKPFTTLLFASGLALAPAAMAHTLEVEFELPSFDVDNYENPYVAIWTEQGREANHLLVWHLHERDEDKWLPDIKRWWRKVGRYDAHLDGMTGATQGPGTYNESFDIGDATQFTFYLEVVREHYDRSLVEVDIDVTNGQTTYTIPADIEVGEVTITLSK